MKIFNNTYNVINMEKKRNIILFVLIALIPLVSLIFNSCSDDDSPDYKSVRTDVYTINPTFAYGSRLIGSGGTYTLNNSWSTGGASFNVFISQNGKLTDLGKIHSKEDNIDEADTKKPLHVKVPIPEDINVNQKYMVIFVDASANATLSDNRIVFDTELARKSNLSARSWYKAEGGSNATAQSFFLATCEGIGITNNTQKSISVKLLGFDVQQKWYASSGTISIDKDAKISSNVTSENGEVESDKQDIKAGKNGWILSTYVPTGKYIKDARMILEINGQVVKTPPASSAATIECGQHYRMFVAWDGENLEWE